MEKMEKLCKVIEQELEKIAEKGLTTSNLETAYKLIDMYKDLKNTYYWEVKEEYYNTMMEDGGYSQNDGYAMNDDYSMRGRKRDRMGRYARNDGMDYEDGLSMARNGRGNRGGNNNRGRNQYSREGYSRDGGYSDAGYERYMDSKQSYRSDKSQDSKQRLMESLEDYMDDFTEKIKEMHRDSDTPEERELLQRFMTKLQNIR